MHFDYASESENDRLEAYRSWIKYIFANSSDRLKRATPPNAYHRDRIARDHMPNLGISKGPQRRGNSAGGYIGSQIFMNIHSNFT
jgi:hypothetical protein